MNRIHTIDIPSNPDELPFIDETAGKIAKKMGFSKEQRDDIAIAVTEAVNNAIMHGNNADPRKIVHITFIVESAILTIKIRDEGPGFDPNSLPDPTAPENILLEKGRGLFIIRHLMDEFHIIRTPHGMELMLVKKL